MEKTLHFIAYYNSQIIQVGFGIVFLLIVVYVYRLFFMPHVAELSSNENLNIEIIEKKLNIIIDQQKHKIQTVTETIPSEKSSEEGASPEEVDKLKAEIYNLHQQLKEAEKKSSEVSSSAASSSASTEDPRQKETTQDSAGNLAQDSATANSVQLEAKISDLQVRLSEYEIIADDIAELSQLRLDNAKLIQELAAVKSGNLPTAESLPQPPIKDNPSGDSTVTMEDQQSIDDFEKNILKKENE